MKRIVIVGGGYAGFYAALGLERLTAIRVRLALRLHSLLQKANASLVRGKKKAWSLRK